MTDKLRVIIVGASGGIGHALLELLSQSPQVSQIYTLSRRKPLITSSKMEHIDFDFTDEANISNAANQLSTQAPFDLIIIATGLLHNDTISPEKTMKNLSAENFRQSFIINTIGPALTAKHFLPFMRKDTKSVFAAISARVGSISDNGLGGWYAYRASKAALNMTLKTLSIEHSRKFKLGLVIGLHPGTVDTALSQPFQSNVAEGKLFTPRDCAQKLISVIDEANFADNGNLLDWAGKTIPF